jgi:starvation-inducible DNA-binding protein
MTDLVHETKVVMANNFALYLKAHNYHFNVEGPNFYQYHKFLEDLYNELWEAHDTIGEHIRALGAYAPASLSRYSELTEIEDELKIPPAEEMIRRLLEDNERVIGSYYRAYEMAEAQQELGISNFFQDRIDIHKKHGWMLRSILKRA